jgi:hypothetical protein
MTYREAIVPACLELFKEGKIRLNSSSPWGFKYTGETEAVESRARKISEGTPYYSWTIFCEEGRKAAAIVRNYPLMKALE